MTESAIIAAMMPAGKVTNLRLQSQSGFLVLLADVQDAYAEMQETLTHSSAPNQLEFLAAIAVLVPVG
jgi:hypothetical protein